MMWLSCTEAVSWPFLWLAFHCRLSSPDTSVRHFIAPRGGPRYSNQFLNFVQAFQLSAFSKLSTPPKTSFSEWRQTDDDLVGRPNSILIADYFISTTSRNRVWHFKSVAKNSLFRRYLIGGREGIFFSQWVVHRMYVVPKRNGCQGPGSPLGSHFVHNLAGNCRRCWQTVGSVSAV